VPLGYNKRRTRRRAEKNRGNFYPQGAPRTIFTRAYSRAKVSIYL